MTVERVPYVQQKDEHSAQLVRQAASSLLNPAGGVIATGGLEVKAKGTPNMEVEVLGGYPSGGIWIPGTSSPAQGMYYANNSSTTGLVVSASSPSNPRIDTVVARIKDEFYAGTGNEFVLEIVTGTPTTGANLSNLSGIASLPASSLALAYVEVPKSASSILTANIKNVVATIKPATAQGLPVKGSVLGTFTSGAAAGAFGIVTATHGLGFTPSEVFPVIAPGGNVESGVLGGLVTGLSSTVFTWFVYNATGSEIGGGRTMQVNFQAYH